MHSTAPVDLADPDAAAAWVDGAAERAGGIDILYNNASAPRVGPFAELSWEDWRFTLHNELDLIFTVTSAAWPHLIARGGGTVYQHRLGVGPSRRDVHRAGRPRRGQGRRARDHPPPGRVGRATRHPRQLDQPRADRHPADRAVPRGAGPPGPRDAPHPPARPSRAARGRGARGAVPRLATTRRT